LGGSVQRRRAVVRRLAVPPPAPLKDCGAALLAGCAAADGATEAGTAALPAPLGSTAPH
jgi:hypothetical protein